MEDYQKRMIEEFKELNDRIVKLEHFLEAPEMKEKRDALSEDMIAAMHCQYSGMVVYRTSLATRLELLGLAENVFEYPDVKVGEIFETDKGEKLRCVSKENGVPIFEHVFDHMDFGGAIKALKEGHKVARKGWNGKGMFLWLKPATEVKAEWCKDPLLKQLADDNGGSIPALGTICMYTHDSTGRTAILTGWLASQSDILMEDWIVVD